MAKRYFKYVPEMALDDCTGCPFIKAHNCPDIIIDDMDCMFDNIILKEITNEEFVMILLKKGSKEIRITGKQLNNT